MRLAAAGLLRAYPLDYAGDLGGTAREFARQRGADPVCRPVLAPAIGAVLAREPAAVAAVHADLTARRDAAANA